MLIPGVTNGNNLFHFCISVECVQLLLDRGYGKYASLVNTKNFDTTPLALAIIMQRYDVAELLLHSVKHESRQLVEPQANSALGVSLKIGSQKFIMKFLPLL